LNNLTEGADGERKKEADARPIGLGPADEQNASGGAGGVLMRLGSEQADVTAWQREAEKRPVLEQRAWPG